MGNPPKRQIAQEGEEPPQERVQSRGDLRTCVGGRHDCRDYGGAIVGWVRGDAGPDEAAWAYDDGGNFEGQKLFEVHKVVGQKGARPEGKIDLEMRI